MGGLSVTVEGRAMPEAEKKRDPVAVGVALAAGALVVFALSLRAFRGSTELAEVRAPSGPGEDVRRRIADFGALGDEGVPALLELAEDRTPVPVETDSEYAALVIPDAICDLALDELRRMRTGSATRAFEWRASSGMSHAEALERWRKKELALAREWWEARCSARSEAASDDGAAARRSTRHAARKPGGEETPREPRPNDAGRFTVATYNIHWDNPDLARTVEILRELDADLVALQETNRESERVLRRELAGAYSHMAFRDGRLGTSAGFLSKSPLRDVTRSTREGDERGAYLCSVELGGRALRVANVHLQPLHDGSAKSALDTWRLFVETEGVRLAQIEWALGLLREGGAAIILGDFNSPAALGAGSLLKEEGFVDSFASVTVDPEARATWRRTVEGAELRFRIDHIFHSKEMRTVRSRIVEDGPSDHFPVVSVLEWTRARPR